ncbi:MAG: 5-deoxy-glucuronate isomerase [Polyangiales bacterium]
MIRDRYTAEELLFRASKNADDGVTNRVTPETAGWAHLGAETRRLRKGQRFTGKTDGNEAVFVVYGGTLHVRSNRGEWKKVGERPHVFAGMPHALYLPPDSTFDIEATSDVAEFAWATAAASGKFGARHITPEDVHIELRGGHNNSRQINQIVPPGFDAERLVSVEVYTPSGNWSSYPPHKHDTHVADAKGNLLEGDLEEVYCYRFAKPNGWALQRIYTPDRTTDATVVAEDGDIVLVPFGYHPVSTGYGYDCYYLNFLAGSAQTLAATDDPAHTWVKETWTAMDPRVPMVTHRAKSAAPPTFADEDDTLLKS